MKRALGALMLLACGCGGVLDVPSYQQVQGRDDVYQVGYPVRVRSGLSDDVAMDIPENITGSLIQISGKGGAYRLAQLTTPGGADLVESGRFVTRDAREVSGLVNWLLPNTPALVLTPGTHHLRFTALDGLGRNIDDDTVTVTLYHHQLTGQAGGRLQLDVVVADGALVDGGFDVDPVIERVVGRMMLLYSQINVSIKDYTLAHVTLDTADVTLNGRGPGTALDAVQKVLAMPGTVRPHAVHIIILHSLDDSVAGYSLGLPGPFDPQPNDAVLIAGGLFGSPSTGTVDEAGLSVTMSHETGHFLGLYHSSEKDGLVHDPIPDTPECSGSGGSCPDTGNIMFWTGGSRRKTFSAGQGSVVLGNPHLEWYDFQPPSDGKAHCDPACPGGQACVLANGQSICLPACDPSSTDCGDGFSCRPSDDGTYVCL